MGHHGVPVTGADAPSVVVVVVAKPLKAEEEQSSGHCLVMQSGRPKTGFSPHLC